MTLDLSTAVRILKAGGLVAFPTETVYGLGADATSRAAVQRIFAAKGRPPTNPLIVHVSDSYTARQYTTSWPPIAARLAEKFWPGPLTLVLPRAGSIAPEVSAGRDTVALRVPAHPLALELLKAFAGPIAAPSANRSNRVSPTTADHVREELAGDVDLILDGGPCKVGIESTVLDLSGSIPVILRPGSITHQQLEAEVGHVGLFRGAIDPAVAAASPGQHAIHYAPRAPAYRFDRRQAGELITYPSFKNPHCCAMIVIGSTLDGTSVFRHIPIGNIVYLPADPDGYAKLLYSALREADRPGVQAIFVEMPPDEARWAAVRDRLNRATREVT